MANLVGLHDAHDRRADHGAQRRQRPGAPAARRADPRRDRADLEERRRARKVLEASEKIAAELREDGLTVKLDDRDIKPGAKYYEWERKGVPLRLEVGPRDLESRTAFAKRRISEG